MIDELGYTKVKYPEEYGAAGRTVVDVEKVLIPKSLHLPPVREAPKK